ncbi:hypothetical protein [Sphingomonas sp.]|uniref:hypothetical protein n=1 Tax=Sphingomonas sp. TaxID=28214 RepID=UPI001B0C7B6E|nr:hypothetical protein [Sphingomonas sp.]MBO9712181.1 hypothetical protein [Sphingomonas sp.]
MAENIDTRVSIDLHPVNVKHLVGADDDTAVYIAPTETAFSTAYEGLRQLHDARAAAEKNQAWTEAHRLIMVDDFGQKVFTRAASAFDSALGNLRKSIASLETEMSAPVTVKAAHHVASEIRAHAKGLDNGERMALVRAAIEEGDDITSGAILGAPSYLSGFDANMQAHFTRMYHEKVNPAKAKQLKVMKAAADHIVSRSGLLHRELEKAIGAPRHKIAQLRKAKDTAQQALVLKDA